jgi:hypothetical protein
MADNVTLNAGSGGAVVATDEIGSVHHQKVKIEFGSTDIATQVDNSPGNRLPVELGDDSPTTIQASQVSAITNTTTTRSTTTGLGKFTLGAFIINITNGGVATGTLQLFLQDSCDGGTTWNDLVSSAQFTFGGALTTQCFFVVGSLASSQPQGTANSVEVLTAGTCRQGPWGDRIRVREKVSGISGSPTGVTYTISAVFKR